MWFLWGWKSYHRWWVLHSFSEQTSLKIEQVKIGMLKPGTLGFSWFVCQILSGFSSDVVKVSYEHVCEHFWAGSHESWQSRIWKGDVGIRISDLTHNIPPRKIPPDPSPLPFRPFSDCEPLVGGEIMESLGTHTFAGQNHGKCGDIQESYGLSV